MDGNVLEEIYNLAESIVNRSTELLEYFSNYLAKYCSLAAFIDSSKSKENGDIHHTFQQNKLIFQSVLRSKLKDMARHLGYINHKLGQRLENFNLEDPAPTVRRSSERGFTSEYLRRFAKNTYRDMLHFVYNYLDCCKKELPTEQDFSTTFLAWTFSDQYLADIHRSAHQDDFNAVILSFWNADFPELHSVIAHELGHAIIDDISNKLDFNVVSKKKLGVFGRLAKRLIAITEGWFPDGSNRELRIDVEIMSDLLATSQFGFAYLYTWFVEFLDDSYGTFHLRDEHGDLPPIQELLDDDAELMLPQILQSHIPDLEELSTYVRGVAIISLVEKMFPNKDNTEREFIKSFKQHLNNILSLRYEETSFEYSGWKTIGIEFKNAIVRSGFAEAARKFNDDRIQINAHWYFSSQCASQYVIEDIKKSDLKAPNSSNDPNRKKYIHPGIRTFHSINIPWRVVLVDNSCSLNNLNHRPSTGHETTQEIETKEIEELNKNIHNRKPIINTVQLDYLYRASFYESNFILHGKNLNNSPQQIEGEYNGDVTESINYTGKVALELYYKDFTHDKSISRARKNALIVFNNSTKSKYSEKPEDNIDSTSELPSKLNIELLTNEFFALDLVLGSNPSVSDDIFKALDSKVSQPGGISNHAITFGRYDYIAYTPLRNSPISSGFDKILKGTCPPPEFVKDFRQKGAFKARRREIRKIDLNELMKDTESSRENGDLYSNLVDQASNPSVVDKGMFVCTLLVTLIDKGLRSYFIRKEVPEIFLNYNNQENLKEDEKIVLNAYSSNGQEDVVLEIFSSEAIKNYKDLFSFIKLFHDSFYTSKTESILCKLPHSSKNQKTSDFYSNYIYIDIGIRLSSKIKNDLFHTSLISVLQESQFEQLKNHIQLSIRPGRYDYVIMLKPDMNTNSELVEKFVEFGEALTQDTSKISRVNTHINVLESF